MYPVQRSIGKNHVLITCHCFVFHPPPCRFSPFLLACLLGSRGFPRRIPSPSFEFPHCYDHGAEGGSGKERSTSHYNLTVRNHQALAVALLISVRRLDPTQPSSSVFQCHVTCYEYAPHWVALAFTSPSPCNKENIPVTCGEGTRCNALIAGQSPSRSTLSETNAAAWFLKLQFVNGVPVSFAHRYDYPHQSGKEPVTLGSL